MPEQPPDRSRIRTILSDAWQSVLGVDEVPPDVAFRDLGGSSRRAVELMLLVREQLPDIAHRLDVFTTPTVDAQVDALAASPPCDPPPVAAERHGLRVESSGEPRQEARPADIAIVAMACRLPGAVSPEALWHDIIEPGANVVRCLPNQRGSDVWPRGDRGWRGGYLDDVEAFDPAFFHVSSAEARTLDPQQRLLLELSWELLERAGLAGRLGGSATAVFVGATSQDFTGIAGDAATLNGQLLALLANRISYFHDLRGPSEVVDTACSSSLVAVHRACSALAAGDAELAIVGGVNLVLTPARLELMERNGMISASGRCHAFDAAADGIVLSDGGALVLLKPLAAALADEDEVLAIIEGSAVNNDGRTNGVNAPSGDAQTQVITAALRRAGVSGAQLQYVEAHGTGTPLGDAIEAGALARALGPHRAPIAIGSLKACLGHLEWAAGIAGLIKVVLALRARCIPPLVHGEPSTDIAWDDLGLELSRRATAWPQVDVRRAGVSSFGAGGTNCHVVVRESTERPAPDLGCAGRVLALSARTPGELRARARALVAHVVRQPTIDVPAIVASAAHGRGEFRHATAARVATRAELTAALTAMATGAGNAERVYAGERRVGGTLRWALVLSGRDPIDFERLQSAGQALVDLLPAPRAVVGTGVIGELAAGMVGGELNREQAMALLPPTSLQRAHPVLVVRNGIVVVDGAPDDSLDGVALWAATEELDCVVAVDAARDVARSWPGAGCPILRWDPSPTGAIDDLVARLFCAGLSLDDVAGARPRRPRPVLPAYPWTRARHWPKGRDAHDVPSNDATLGPTLRTPAWAEQPRTRYECPQRILLVDTGGGVGEAVARALRGRTLTYSDRADWSAPEQATEAARQFIVDELDAVLVIWPASDRLGAGTADTNAAATARDWTQSMCGLTRALARRRASRPLKLLAVTVRAQAAGATVEPDPAGAVFAPLLAVTGVEVPTLVVGCLDVDDGNGLASHVQAELDGALDPYVAIRDGRRFVRRWRALPFTATKPPSRAGTWIVTGATGGVGSALAEHLARGRAARVALLSRDAANREDLVERVRAVGADAAAFAVDLADPEACVRAVAAVRERFGEVAGVVHCAGAVRDVMLATATPADIDAVFMPKAIGADNLARALGTAPGHWIACSSQVTALPLAGQAAYAAANGFLEAHARASGLFGCAIAWSTWRDVGVAADLGVVGSHAQHGVRPLATAEAVGCLDQAVAMGEPLVLAGDLDPPLAAALDVRGITVRESFTGASLSGEAHAADRTADDITAILAKLLDSDPGQLDRQANFFELGASSRDLIALTAELAKRTRIDIPDTTCFARPTINELGAWLTAQNTLQHATPRSGDAAAGANEAAPVPQVSSPPAVAIVGMACRFPGAADPQGFLKLLLSGQSMIGTPPAARQPAALGPLGIPATTVGAFLNQIDRFDPLAFGISPREAAWMDPQQRLALELAREALDRAGYGDPGPERERTGVIFGSEPSVYASAAALTAHSAGGGANSNALVANRISYALGLGGPSLVVDTACSSSAVAIHLAVADLLVGRCDMVLAGGVKLFTSPGGFAVNAAAGMLSPSGRLRTFDAGADGYVRGEGGAVLVLKRLTDALSDGDVIEALILGTSIGHDGRRKTGLTAPSPAAQSDTLRAAWRSAGVEPKDIDYIETHGTGTPLGDPLEASAIGDALGQRRDPCAIGSLKPTIGHTEAAAGVAGVLKVALALRSGRLPATVGIERPSDAIDWERSRLRLVRRNEPWPATEPRRAGVSSFGFGGANAHIVLQEPPRSPVAPAADPIGVIFLSARSEAGLTRFAAALDKALAAARHTVADIEATLNGGRARFDVRAAILGRELDEIRAGLRTLADGREDPMRVLRGSARTRHSQRAADSDALGLGPAELARLHCDGGEADWRAIAARSGGRRIDLPLAPLESERCWARFETPAADESQAPRAVVHAVSWRPGPRERDRHASAGPVAVIGRPAVVDAAMAALDGADYVACTGDPVREIRAGRCVVVLDPALSGTVRDPRDRVADLLALAAAGPRLPGRVIVVTAGAVAAQSGEESDIDPGAAFGSALAAAWAQETRGAGVVVLDLPRARSWRELGRAVAWARTASPGLVAWRDGPLRPALEAVGARAVPLEVDALGSHVVLGGTGGLGGHIAFWLADRGAQRIALLSRQGERHPAAPTLERGLRGKGADVRFLSVDAVDSSALRDALDDVRESWGSITGVVHAAGVIDVKRRSLRAKTPASCEEIFGVKVAGTQYLEAHTRDDPLRYFLVCSSICVSIPGLAAGQADYAAACAWQDAFALGRHGPGVTRSIQWTAIDETGISVGRSPSAAMRSAGIDSLAVDDALAALEDLGPGAPVVTAVVGHSETNSVSTVIGEAKGVAPRADAAHPTGTRWLIDAAAQVLGTAPELLETDRSLAEYGLDSLMVADLVGLVEAGIGRRVTPEDILEHDTIDALARHFGSSAHPEPLAEPVRATRARSHARVPRRTGGAAIAEPIAVIGIACRVPQADGPAAFWENLLEGRSAIGAIPAERWPSDDDFFDPGGRGRGRSVSRWGGFLSSAGMFDCGQFGMSPEHARNLDPQHRIALELAFAALADAGKGAPSSAGRAGCGVFLGARGTPPAHARRSGHRPARPTDYAQNLLAGRISDSLDLSGPSLVVDTACSSSLFAVHLACQSLRSGECDVALAGGVDLLLSPWTYIELSAAGALSPRGRCATFDASADGYVPGEGGVLFALARHDFARTHGDDIYALLLGAAANNDGRTMGLTTPNGRSQERVIRRALAQAGIDPGAVGYVEAHGTGTAIGDPIEVAALRRALGDSSTCLIGSVKTSVGHLHSAAGAVGLLKAVLSVARGEIPPTLNVIRASPRLALGQLEIARTRSRWPDDRRRVAGVSSFGFGGTNVHAVVAEPDVGEPVYDDPPNVAALALAAHSRQALAERERSIAEGPADPASWAILSRSVASQAVRVALVGPPGDLHRALNRGDVPSVRRFSGRISGRDAPGVTFLFPGQGAQYSQMGCELAARHRGFRERLEQAASAVDSVLGQSIIDVLHTATPEKLAQTHLTQPAVFAVEYALAQMWIDAGVLPTTVLGHSAGEIAAACVAGALTLPDAAMLVVNRGRLMDELCPAGDMLALDGKEATVRDLVEGGRGTVTLVAHNAPGAMVVAGLREDVDAIASRARERGVRATALRVSHAFHSPTMEPMVGEFARVARGLTHARLRIPMLSSARGGRVDSIEPDYWVDQVRAPVLFAAAAGFCRDDVFLECGPGRVLGGLVLRSLSARTVHCLASLPRPHSEHQAWLRSAAELWCLGVDLDWASVQPSPSARHRMLAPPTLERVDCGLPIERLHDAAPCSEPATQPYRLDLVHRTDQQVVLGCDLDRGQALVSDHTVDGEPYLPGVTWLEFARAALCAAGRPEVTLRDVSFTTPLVCAPNGTRLRIVLDLGEDILRFKGESRDHGERAWTIHARGFAGIESALAPAIDVASVRARCPARMGAHELYARIRSVGIRHGPFYAAVQQVWAGSGEALGRLVLPDAPHMALHPVMLDAATTVGAALTGGDGAWSARHGEPFIPFHIDRVDPVAPLGSACWCHLRLVRDTREISTFDVDLTADDGTVLVRVRGFTSKRKRSDHASVRRLAWVGGQPIHQPSMQRRAAAPHVLLLGGADDELVELVRAAREQCGAPVHVVPLAGAEGILRPIEAFIARVGGGPLQVLQVTSVPAFHGLENVERELRTTATWLRALLSGVAGDADIDVRLLSRAVATGEAPSPAPASSLLASLRHEAPLWTIQTLELDGLSAANRAALAGALSTPPTVDRSLLRDGRLLALGLEAIAAPERVARLEGVQLVTGATGSIGWLLVDHLVAVHGVPVACIGRDLPRLDALATAVEAAGGQAVTVVADVTDRRALAAALDHAREVLGPLRGVFHLAGALRDGLMRNMDTGDLDATLRPKLHGVRLLDELTRLDSLAHFTVFSSVSAIHGGLGQGAYAAANAALDAFATQRAGSARPGKTKSIGWSLWQHTGMGGDPRAQRALEARGGRPLTPRAALKALDRVLAGAETHVVVEHDGGPAPVPQPAPVPAPAVRGEALETRLARELRNRIAALIGRPTAELDDARAFLDLGMDSAQIVELSATLADSIGLLLSPTVMFEHISIRALSRHLAATSPAGVTRMFEAIRRSEGEDAPRRPTVAATEGDPVGTAVPVPRSRNACDHEVAIIGYGARLPAAPDPAALWRLLQASRSAIYPMGRERWTDARDGPEPWRAALLDGIDRFDAEHFGMAPRDVVEMDVQQRLAIEVAWEVLERSGYGRRARGSHAGVFVGLMNHDATWEAARGGAPIGVGSGTSPAVLANRISYLFDLHGPSMPVETACSSSLVAVHIACLSLADGESDLALAGGVNIMQSPDNFAAFMDHGLLSPVGRSRPFGVGADGYVRGEGVAFLLLKPLVAALADGDVIHGVIRGSAVGHDGRTNGLSSPNALAQADVITRALHGAGVSPQQVSYIEAHGTSTALGDPIEVQGLARALGADRIAGGRVIGSLKGNVGHLEAAAGVAGLIKVLLAFEHGRLPASLHGEAANPLVDLDGAGLRLARRLTDWTGPSPLVAGISSFGFGGTNAHVVLQESPRLDLTPQAPRDELVVVSASSPEKLAWLKAELRDQLENGEDWDVARVSRTVLTRAPLPYRLGVVVASRQGLVAALAGEEYTRAGQRPPTVVLVDAGPAPSADTLDEFGRLSPPASVELAVWVAALGDVARWDDDVRRSAFAAACAAVLRMCGAEPQAVTHRAGDHHGAQVVVALGDVVPGATHFVPTSTSRATWTALLGVLARLFEMGAPLAPDALHDGGSGRILPALAVHPLEPRRWASPGRPPLAELLVRAWSPMPALAPGRTPRGWIIVDADNELTSAVGRALVQGGDIVAGAIEAGTTGKGLKRHLLDAVVQARARYGDVAVCHVERGGDGRGEPTGALARFHGTLTALRAEREPCALWALTTRATAGEDGGQLDPCTAALWSAAQVAAQEGSKPVVHVLDVGARETDLSVAARVLRATNAPRRARIAGSVVLEPIERPATVRVAPRALGSTWWVIGATGAVGIELTEHLARRGVHTLLVSSRSIESADSPRRRLDRLREAGCAVECIPMDLLDQASVDAAIATVAASTRGLDGVLIAAGTAGAGRRLHRLHVDDLVVPMSTMVAAARLQEALAPLRPGLVVHCASLSAARGGVGFGDYAAAHAYVGASASNMRAAGLNVLTIGWDAWAHTGIADDIDTGLSVPQALAAFDAALDACEPHTLVVAPIAKPSSDGPDCAADSGDQATALQPPGESLLPGQEQSHEEIVLQIAAQALGAAPAGVRREVALADQGMDSRMALELLENLERTFHIDVPLDLLDDHPSVSEIVAWTTNHDRDPDRLAG